MIELNLLPDVKQEFVRSQRMKRKIIAIAILASLASLGLLALIASFVYIAQPVRGVLADDAIKKGVTTLKKNKNLTRDLTLQNQLNTITQLHEEKGVAARWIDYLKVLNPYEPNNVSITKAVIDPVANTITLEATVKTFGGLTVFKDTLSNAKIIYMDPETEKRATTVLFSDIQMTDSALIDSQDGGKVVGFKAILAYEPNAVAWAIDNPILSVPNLKTTPSASRVNLFVEKAKKQEAGN